MKFKFKFLLLVLMLVLVSSLVLGDKEDFQYNNEAYYSFDDVNVSGTTLYEYLGTTSYDGTISGATTGVSNGDFNEAFSFDGSNDYVSTTENFDINTITFKFKYDGTQPTFLAGQRFDSSEEQGNWGFACFDGDEICQLAIYAPSFTSLISSSTGFGDDDWHSVIISSGSNGLKYWIDGTLEASDSYTGLLGANSNDDELMIGRFGQNGVWSYAYGEMDELYIFTQQFTQANVTEWETFTSNIYGVAPVVSNTTYFDITASNVASVSLFNFTALVNGVSYSTTNGTINTDINQTLGLEYDVVVSANDYYVKTYEDYNTSTDLVASGLYQSIVKVYPIEVLTNNNIVDSYNITDDLGIVSPAYKGVSPSGLGEYAFLYTLLGNRTFTFSSSIYDYYDTSVFASIVNNTQSIPLTGVHDYKLNFSAKVNLTSAVINNFTVNLTSNNSYDETLSTSNGFLTFNVLAGYDYDSVIDSPLYAFSNSTHEITVVGSSIYTYYLWLTNSVYVYIYDEETNDLIDYQTVNLEFIADSESRVDSTSSGLILFDNLLADSYRIRYDAINYSERSYFVDVANRGFQEINLFLLKSNVSANITAVVYNNIGDPVEDATVKMLKYYIGCNCYNTVQVEQTSFDGSVDLLIDSYNNELYKFIISFGGVDYLETDPFKINSDLLNFFIDFSQFNPTETVSDLLKIGYDLSFNENNNQFTFTFSDSGSSVVSGCLKVYKETPSNSVLINSTCVSGTASTINIGVEEINGTTYKAVAVVDLNNEDYVLDFLYHSFKFGKMVSGLVGVFLTMFIVIGFALISLWNPTISIILTVIALIFSSALGILNIGLSALMGVVAIAFILVVRNRS